MSEKSIVQEARDIQLAMELITLGARLQMLESETQLSRGRLIKLYKELRGSPPPKGMLPFSTDWFMTWEQNVHASMFCNAWQFLLKTGLCNGVDAVIKAYRLYLEQCPQAEEGRCGGHRLGCPRPHADHRDQRGADDRPRYEGSHREVSLTFLERKVSKRTFNIFFRERVLARGCGMGFDLVRQPLFMV